MVTRLQVTYKNPETDSELDKKILEFLNTLDFICIGRAYHPVLFTRDLFFERQSKEIENGSKRDKEAQLTT